MASSKIIGENENVVRIMSIHKSKGLEFPIVFLSGTSKKINLQDLNNELLLHQKLGIGPQYINYDKKIEYSTSAKDAIKIVIKDETISEEMRILYVALTRAKEKLIITGTVKDFDKNITKKRELLKIYGENKEKINPILLKKYISYLDWILLVYLKKDLNKIITLNTYKKEDIIKYENEEKEVNIKNDFNFNKETDLNYIKEELNWKYEYITSTILPIKSTVSKVKEIKNQDLNGGIDFDETQNKKIGLLDLVPSFTLEEVKASGARKGTLMHLFLENIDINKDYSDKDLETLLEELITKKLIQQEEKNLINMYEIKKYLNSNLVKKLKNCKKIEKEKEFCIKINASEIFDEAKDEKILVQGIIDLYGVTNEENIILIDYKTDFVNDGDLLVKKYINQLKIYKDALEKALNKKVTEVYIYSLHLNKEIQINI